VQELKRNQSSDSSVSIKGDVSIGGDGAIGSNAKIIKTIKGRNKISLFDISVGILILIGTLIAIYSLFKGK